jgi:ribonucleoside-diphosphate reductase alpha chain
MYDNMAEHLYVIKRNGDRVPVSFDQILQRIRMLSDGIEHVNPDLVAQKVCNQLQDGMSTSQLDEFAAETCAMMQARFHPNYGTLAARILINNHHKNTPNTLLECIEHLYHGPVQLISDEYHDKVCNHAAKYQEMIDYSRDNMFDYFGFKTLEKGYLLKQGGKLVERPQHMWMRVAIQLHGADMYAVKETYDALSQGYFIHATPTLFNSGGLKPQLSSCFLLTMNDDSIKGIYKTLGDCAQISKWAGGIGLSIHNIRARGSKIHGTNGESTGLVPMLKVFNDTAKYVNQGGKRNGSFAIYLEPWHADIEEFLRLKLNQGAEEDRARDLFYGLWIPDLFMKRMEAKQDWTLMCPAECPGLADCHSEEFEKLYESYEKAGKGRKTIPAQKLWQMILDAQIQTGTPYLCYKDAANSKSNQQHLGTIKSSNLCVAPETLVLTDKGYFPIREMCDSEVNVWNGQQWSNTTVRKTGINQKLIKVTLSDGTVLDCTPYHKFILNDGERKETRKSIGDSTRVEAQNLKVGMKLVRWNAPVIEGCSTDDFKYAYTHGFFCGDGTYNNAGSTPMISLYGEKKKLTDHLDIRTSSGVEDSFGRRNVYLYHDIPTKYAVPMNATIKNKLEWLSGLMDADGTTIDGTNTSVQIASINYTFLNHVRLMMQTVGVRAKVTLMRGPEKHMMSDGCGGLKEYDCKPLYRVLIRGEDVSSMVDLGLNTHRLVLVQNPVKHSAMRDVKVVSVEDCGRISDTYCFNEPINHAGVFGGVLTSQCTEIMEFTSPDESAVCNLGSLALPKFVDMNEGTPIFNFEKLRGYTSILTHNLDIVINKNYYPTPECRNSNMRHRPIGIGIQGLADVFALMRLPWTSEGATKLNREIFENIYYAAMSTSISGTLEGFNHGTFETIGEYPSYKGSPLSQGKMQFDLWNEKPKYTPYLDWDNLRNKLSLYGARNSLLIAPMPTASTSQILGNNECFEPFTSNLYARRVLAGDFMVINKYLVEDLTKLSLWTTDVRTQIIADNGSVQNITQIPAHIRDLYKTAWEIPQKTLINMARDRAPFICQSQSLNLFLAEPTYAKISSMHVYAWKQGLKTGCYYLRTKAVSSAQKFTIEVKAPEECLTCSS